MNNTLKITALGFALAVGLSATSLSFAKGHDQGFGAGLAGPATSKGFVGGLQNNRDQTGPYGTTDAAPEAKAGEQDNSEAARDRDSDTSNHPSDK